MTWGSILRRVTSSDSWLDFSIQSSVRPCMTHFVELVGFLRSPSSTLANKRNCQERLPRNSIIKRVFGSEITTTARIAKMNMILFGDGHSGVSQRDSLLADTTREYNNVLSNIPFSQNLSEDILNRTEGHSGHSAKDADEACVLKCFNSLKVGGSMAIVVPEGLLVNKSHRKMLRFILGKLSRQNAG